MSIIESLENRHAVKKFDAEANLDAEKLQNLLKAINLAPTSYGLQPFKVLVIKNKKLRAEMQAKCWGQPQIVESNVVLAFVHEVNYRPELVDEYLQRMSETQGLDLDSLSGRGKFLKGKLEEKNAQEYAEWTAKQAYIALGVALSAAANLDIDCCPMEGFEKAELNHVLGLDQAKQSVAVLLAVGSKQSAEKSLQKTKVRKKWEELLEFFE